MTPRDISEIHEAEAELKKAEAGFPSQASAEMFKDAFQSLEDFIEFATPSGEVVVFGLESIEGALGEVYRDSHSLQMLTGQVAWRNGAAG